MHFLNIAKGSSAELRTQLHIACEIGIVSDSDRNELMEELIIISRKLHRLIQAFTSPKIINAPNT